ncbi:hypothetical protein EYF80_062055 [Liparis tanakae]|uniref:Uncharacterized protein n=1 Tax=Liparis tanakae TaxID=230148 RepID=A0A4Z2EGB6_9TELE|nr:hypothetical protein EYF80_062055 [Liparis tanakae]
METLRCMLLVHLRPRQQGGHEWCPGGRSFIRGEGLHSGGGASFGGRGVRLILGASRGPGEPEEVIAVNISLEERGGGGGGVSDPAVASYPTLQRARQRLKDLLFIEHRLLQQRHSSGVQD